MGGVDSPFALGVSLPDYRFRIEFWAILGCVVLFGVLLELVRRHQLKERYSFLWFLTAVVLLVLTLKRKWLEDLAGMIGVYYPPSALFLLLVFFMLLILIHFSTVITKLIADNQTLVQQSGILESRIRTLEELVKGPESSPNPGEGSASSGD